MKSIGRVRSFFGNVGILLRGYFYLRTLGASSIEKSTVSASRFQSSPTTEADGRTAEQVACSIEAMRSGEECEACQ